MRQLIVLTALMAFAIPAYAAPVHQVQPVVPHVLTTHGFATPPLSYCGLDPTGIFLWLCNHQH